MTAILNQGFLTAAKGMGTVFVVLILLWGLLELLKLLLHTVPNRIKDKKTVTPVSVSDVTSALTALDTGGATQNEIAAITAAISCYMESSGHCGSKFVVRSIRRNTRR